MPEPEPSYIVRLHRALSAERQQAAHMSEEGGCRGGDQVRPPPGTWSPGHLTGYEGEGSARQSSRGRDGAGRKACSQWSRARGSSGGGGGRPPPIWGGPGAGAGGGRGARGGVVWGGVVPGNSLAQCSTQCGGGPGRNDTQRHSAAGSAFRPARSSQRAPPARQPARQPARPPALRSRSGVTGAALPGETGEPAPGQPPARPAPAQVRAHDS